MALRGQTSHLVFRVYCFHVNPQIPENSQATWDNVPYNLYSLQSLQDRYSTPQHLQHTNPPIVGTNLEISQFMDKPIVKKEASESSCLILLFHKVYLKLNTQISALLLQISLAMALPTSTDTRRLWHHQWSSPPGSLAPLEDQEMAPQIRWLPWGHWPEAMTAVDCGYSPRGFTIEMSINGPYKPHHQVTFRTLRTSATLPTWSMLRQGQLVNNQTCMPPKTIRLLTDHPLVYVYFSLESNRHKNVELHTVPNKIQT